MCGAFRHHPDTSPREPLGVSMTWTDRLQSIGRTDRGYDPAQVRDIVWRIDQALSGRIPHAVTASDVTSTVFDVVAHGHNMTDVDDLLGDAIRHLRALRPVSQEALPVPLPTRSLDRRARVELLRRCWELRGKRFKRARFGRGYRVTEVDDFTDLVAGRYGNGMSPDDVRNVLFHERWRGYDEAEVDDWLDALERLLAAEGR